ncbi:hypothetical protein I317_05120 [Kwoniella heveanensis CBS 569]|nr:hypothetical protein I317_05120 [Kwoniella heveanensis CBS 569]
MTHITKHTTALSHNSSNQQRSTLQRLWHNFLLDLHYFFLLPWLFGRPVVFGHEMSMVDLLVQTVLAPIGLVWVIVGWMLQPAWILFRWSWVAKKAHAMAPSSFKIRSTNGTHMDDVKRPFFYINGMAMTPRGVRADVEALSRDFDRRVTGLHNRSFGPFFDLCMCILQRNFEVRTPASKHMFKIIKKALKSSTTENVVLLCHSQGGLLVSQIIWKIERDESLKDFKQKLEVYAFASAALSMGDWRISGGSVHGGFRRVESFANGGDWVARIGELEALQC